MKALEKAANCLQRVVFLVVRLIIFGQYLIQFFFNHDINIHCIARLKLIEHSFFVQYLKHANSSVISSSCLLSGVYVTEREGGVLSCRTIILVFRVYVTFYFFLNYIFIVHFTCNLISPNIIEQFLFYFLNKLPLERALCFVPGRQVRKKTVYVQDKPIPYKALAL